MRLFLYLLKNEKYEHYLSIGDAEFADKKVKVRNK